MMKILLIATTVFAASAAFAQAPQGPPTQVPQITAADLENQLSEVGCKAERQAASQTIMQLRQQNADLQKQLSKLDPPPKGGATKH